MQTHLQEQKEEFIGRSQHPDETLPVQLWRCSCVKTPIWLSKHKNNALPNDKSSPLSTHERNLP